MTKKESLNFNVPAPLKNIFYELAHKHGDKRKWAVCGAAILLLAELPESLRDAYVQRVMQADLDNDAMGQLIDDAVSGNLAKEVRDAYRKPKERTVSDQDKRVLTTMLNPREIAKPESRKGRP